MYKIVSFHLLAQRINKQFQNYTEFPQFFIPNLKDSNKKELPSFKKIKAPTDEEVRDVNLKIKKRFLRVLRKKGLVEDFEEGNTQFLFPECQNLLKEGYASSIQRKIAWGERKAHLPVQL